MELGSRGRVGATVAVASTVLEIVLLADVPGRLRRSRPVRAGRRAEAVAGTPAPCDEQIASPAAQARRHGSLAADDGNAGDNVWRNRRTDEPRTVECFTSAVRAGCADVGRKLVPRGATWGRRAHLRDGHQETSHALPRQWRFDGRSHYS